MIAKFIFRRGMDSLEIGLAFLPPLQSGDSFGPCYRRRQINMPQSKQVFAFLLALSLCLVAIWREMQALAIVAFLLSVLAIHRRQSMLLFDQGMSLLSRTKALFQNKFSTLTYY